MSSPIKNGAELLSAWAARADLRADGGLGYSGETLTFRIMREGLGAADRGQPGSRPLVKHFADDVDLVDLALQAIPAAWLEVAAARWRLRLSDGAAAERCGVSVASLRNRADLVSAFVAGFVAAGAKRRERKESDLD